MSKFDDIFSRKVKEAFENYDADHLADRGWNSFAGKYGRKRSRIIIFPLWARAASIIILVTAGVLFINRLNHRQVGEQTDRLAKESRTVITDSLKIKEDSAAAVQVITGPEKTSMATVIKAGQAMPEESEKRGEEPNETAGPVLAESIETTHAHESEKVQEEGMPVANPAIADVSLNYEPTNVVGSSAGVNLASSPLELRLTDEIDTRMNLKPKPALMDYLVLPRERMTTTLMTGFSGMMASIDNAGSNAQGVSIGFYVEQQLSRRISVRPGLAMARHSYSLENTPGGSAAFNYDAPELNGMSGITTSFNADIDVVSMEVPVNFVFSIRKRGESTLFVTTGASTVLYLSQHLSGNFNNTYTKTIVDSYGDVSYESMTTSVRIESEQELMNRVDFMGLANFSAGYSFPFAGISHLVFEPFVQLPIKDLTSMNLRIRYGGLSFKVQF